MPLTIVRNVKPDPAADQQLALAFKALGHPARLTLTRLLASRKDWSFKDLAGELDLTPPTVFQHLGQLVEAGLAARVGEGKAVRYRFNARGGDPLEALIRDLSKRHADAP
jgi:DNA-binding transcriptional ArsR family regulator